MTIFKRFINGPKFHIQHIKIAVKIVQSLKGIISQKQTKTSLFLDETVRILIIYILTQDFYREFCKLFIIDAHIKYLYLEYILISNNQSNQPTGYCYASLEAIVFEIDKHIYICIY